MGDAVSLFDLFKEFAELEIVDAKGRKSTLVMRSLDVFENQRATKKMETVRQASAKRLDTPDMRADLAKNLVPLKPDQLIEQILNMERPVADENQDLAPPPKKPETADGTVAEAPKTPAAEKSTPAPEKDAKDSEKDTVARWEETRRAELEPMDAEALTKILVDLQVRGMIGMEVIMRFIDEQLVRMVVDRESQKPVFTLDNICPAHPTIRQGSERETCSTCEAELEPAPNHIARVHPSTREELIKLRKTFLEGKADKALRAVVTAAPFLPSGESVVAPADTPGGTTATPQLSLTG